MIHSVSVQVRPPPTREIYRRSQRGKRGNHSGGLIPSGHRHRSRHCTRQRSRTLRIRASIERLTTTLESLPSANPAITHARRLYHIGGRVDRRPPSLAHRKRTHTACVTTPAVPSIKTPSRKSSRARHCWGRQSGYQPPARIGREWR
ncbi:hypothetical protein BC834DRAFT_887129 [Gloeopeniophorella convolvens]|nr:hypothetical protein BC834DRAFT_887129 [Gloeopeniophorella convolvens]